MKNRIYLLGFFCILLCVLFSVPAYANELSQNLETESVSEIVTTSTATISPADNFLKIGESQRYTCIGATGIVTWTISDTNIATVNATGRVTGVSQGQTYLTAMWDGGSLSVTIKVGALEEGTYYIQNFMSGLYMELENSAVSEGTPIEQSEFDGGNQSRWIIKMEDTGYYSIRSALTNKYIGVENSSTVEGAAIKQYNSIANQRSRQWKISATSNGTYRFIPYSYTIMCLSVPVNASLMSGTNLVQLKSINVTDYRDEWIVYAQKDYTLMYIGSNVGDSLMPPIVSAVDSALRTNANLDGYAFTSLTKNEALVYLSSSSIFSCITHGLRNSIDVSDGELTIADLASINNSAFNQLKLVYLGACLTGMGGANHSNLVNSFYNKGVDTVLGFTIEVNVYETNSWTKHFMLSLSQGNTIASAMEVADDAVKQDPTVNVITYTTSENYRYLVGSDQLTPCS